MQFVIYVSKNMKDIIDNAEIIIDEKVKDGEICLVDPSQVYDAVAKGKSQVPIGKVCLEFKADEEDLRLFSKHMKMVDQEDKEENGK